MPRHPPPSMMWSPAVPRRTAFVDKRRSKVANWPLLMTESEEIGIRNLTRRRDLVDIDKIGVHQAEIILPENMAGEGAQARDNRRDGGRGAGGIGIFRMTGDPEGAILCKRAGCP